MREKHIRRSPFDADILYECDYWDYIACIKIFGDTKALFCDWHLIYKDDNEIFLQSIGDFYNIGYTQWRDDMEEKIQDKIQEQLFNF